MSNYIMKEYDEALASILNEGFIIDGDRTGVGTICKFGISTKYDISERFPILTKRKIFYKSIFKEVLWYISGSSNINDLEKSGSKIWTPWKNKEFTDYLSDLGFDNIYSSKLENGRKISFDKEAYEELFSQIENYSKNK